ncbi:hypothetical protein SAICODRAFT_29822 [Saitoella complicata NRRL Y-17804]|nr:uncharacterized protein SAICODRAFT_29822 [Saitoella complicata NRRL Y-17804]ODQ53834.1 hypothetical protein SAICODRAFT_29822 [Saitoella complicata NRRL Y-17804]
MTSSQRPTPPPKPIRLSSRLSVSSASSTASLHPECEATTLDMPSKSDVDAPYAPPSPAEDAEDITIPAGRAARALFDFNGDSEFNELSFTANSALQIVEEDLGGGWMLAVHVMTGARGLVPGEYVTFTTDFGQRPRTPTRAHSYSIGHAIPSTPGSDTDSIYETFLFPSPSSSIEAHDDIRRTGGFPTGHDRIRSDSSSKTITGGQTTPAPPLSTPYSTLRSHILQGINLNHRFSAFVTTGVEGFISAPTCGETSSEVTLPAETIVLDGETHYIENGPRWKAQSPAFIVKVHDPRKHVGVGGLHSYVVYTVTSTLANDASTVVIDVERRYSQFEWLARKLAAKFPLIIMPSLGEKRIAGRFNEEFLETRRRALERWLGRVVRHPILRYSAVVTFFLGCENDQEFKSRVPDFDNDKLVGQKFFENVYHPSFNVDGEGDSETLAAFSYHARNTDRLMPSLLDSMRASRASAVESASSLRQFGLSAIAVVTAHGAEPHERSMNLDGAWCWRQTCTECVACTKRLQSMADALIAEANLAGEQAVGPSMISVSEAFEEWRSPARDSASLLATHASTLQRHTDVTSGSVGENDHEEEEEQVKARCDTVFNVILSEIDRMHTERQQDFSRLALEVLNGRIEYHERALEILKAAKANVETANATSRVKPSKYERLISQPVTITATDAGLPNGPTSVASSVETVSDVVSGVYNRISGFWTGRSSG